MVVGIRNAPDDDPEVVARGGEHPVRMLGEDLARHSFALQSPGQTGGGGGGGTQTVSGGGGIGDWPGSGWIPMIRNLPPEKALICWHENCS